MGGPAENQEPSPWAAADEDRHAPATDPAWREGWTFDAWTPDGGSGVSTALVLWPHANRAWYWCALLRPGQPLVHLVDLDVGVPRVGLEVRSHGLWAAHTCEAPFEQWTVANEAYAVALDDPEDALGRALGTPTAVAFDLEWYADAPPVSLTGGELVGYRQAGEVHGLVDLAGGALTLLGPASRTHWWGTDDPWPWGEGCRLPEGLAAPVRLGAYALERVLTPHGWHQARRPL